MLGMTKERASGGGSFFSRKIRHRKSLLSAIVDFYTTSLFVDIHMILIRTPFDLGALIRERQRKLGLDQNELARRTGASRQWVVAIERGKSGAQLGLVLRALTALGIALTAVDQGPSARRYSSKRSDLPPIDINRVISSLRRPAQ